uniref:TBC1 domain family member 7 n=1 Tax=Trichuris muris TaxID=70415 RepID=A0A5S6PZ56_TRIMR
MFQTEKNFRLSYLAKVGFPAVDLEKAIEQLLSARTVEREKLVQLCFTHELPNSHRLKAWNLLIGVTAHHEECAEFVLKQRKEHLDLLFRSLGVMRLTCYPVDSKSIGVPCSVLSFAYILERNLCPLGIPKEYPMFTLVHSVVKLLTNESLEQYWLCRNICLLLEQTTCIRSSIISEAENFLTKNEAQLCKIALSHSLSPKAALQFCFDWTFYLPFHPEVLLKLWDKMVAGSLVINLFVLVECLSYIHRFGKAPLASKDDLADSIKQISQSKQQNLVECAIDCWLHKGKQMESRLSTSTSTKVSCKHWRT